ncbi:hypothetical protein DXG03_006855 [Asterophora parasitica]|uniref:Uncharacterized protein n=1 Tax=Asterophora parasitica TaxID=117018 RepID=A0A9P7GAG2_9AGAR|nr:hypothetical protein DXG03_006855 [Asterophora parasitica]
MPTHHTTATKPSIINHPTSKPPRRSVIIDDSSPQISYTGTWKLGGTAEDYNFTTHGSAVKGSQVTITFTGNFIEVYGTIGLEHNDGDATYSPITTYTIDGKAKAALSFTGTPANDMQFQRLFYKSPRLAKSKHQLVVTLMTDQKNMFWIDYFIVGTRPPPTALIVGGVASAIIGILLLVLMTISLCRKSRKSPEEPPGQSQLSKRKPFAGLTHASSTISNFIMKYPQAALIACVSGATLASTSSLGQSTSQPSVERRDGGSYLGAPSQSPHISRPVTIRRTRDLDDGLISSRALDDEHFVRALHEELVERGVMSDGMDLAVLGRSLIDEEVYARELEEELVARTNPPIGRPSRKNPPAAQSGRRRGKFPSNGPSSLPRPYGLPKDVDLTKSHLDGPRTKFTSNGPSSLPRPYGLPKDFDPTKSHLDGPRTKFTSNGGGLRRDLGLYDDLDARDFDLDQLD